MICILLSAVASAASSLFLQSLIDDYIVPLLGSSVPVFHNLLKALIVIGSIYLIGIISTLFYNRVMVTIAQGTLKKSGMKCLKKCKGFRSVHLIHVLMAIL